jgi:hypothetical protein
MVILIIQLLLMLPQMPTLSQPLMLPPPLLPMLPPLLPLLLLQMPLLSLLLLALPAYKHLK